MPQLRGESLKNAIRDGIILLAKKAKEGRKKYIFNASELTRTIKVSRPSLAKHADVIDEILAKLKSEKRERTGQATFEHLRAIIEKLVNEKDKQRKEIDTMRKHHVDIYSILLESSSSLSCLIKPIVREAYIREGKCIICNSNVEVDVANVRNNVRPLRPIKE